MFLEWIAVQVSIDLGWSGVQRLGSNPQVSIFYVKRTINFIQEKNINIRLLGTHLHSKVVLNFVDRKVTTNLIMICFQQTLPVTCVINLKVPNKKGIRRNKVDKSL